MTAVSKPFPVFDGDSHIVEPADIWQRYLDPEYRVTARSAFSVDEEAGVRTTILNGQLLTRPTPGGLPLDAVWRPGMTEDAIAAALDADFPLITPGAHDPAARLADMDAMAVDQALLFPTYFAEHFPEIENPDIAWALARAYNDWLHNFCSAAPGRLFPAAVLPLQSITATLKELRRVVAKGFKAAFIRPSFYNRMYLNHPYFDPLWDELQRSDIVAAIHPATGSSNQEWRSHGPFVERVSKNFGTKQPVASTIAPAMDNELALATLLSYAHLDRFPRLRWVFAHSQATWLPLALEKAEGYLTTIGRAEMPVRPLADEVFYERPAMIGCDAHELGLHKMYDVFEDKAIWGSRYPYADATSALDAMDQLRRGGVPEPVIRKLMGENGARFYQVGLSATAAG